MIKVIGRTLFGFSIALCSASCVVPPRDGLARVRVDDVVKRVKCEMARAVLEKTNERADDGKTHPFTFLLDWAVKLHFIIAVDDTGSINPGATLINPLPAVGSVGQSRSVGIGVGLTSEAVRQEEYEYLMSFASLRDEFKDRSRAKLYNFCQLDQGLLLESELGLKALVDAALEPVKSEVLRAGSGAVGPGAAPPPQGKLPDPAGQFDAIVQKRKSGNFVDFGFGGSVATDVETQTQAIINNVVKPLYGIASASSFESKCFAQLTLDQNKAIIASIGVSTNVAKYNKEPNDDNLAAVRREFLNTVNAANDMITCYQICAKTGKKDHKTYDPISTIGQTVNFYITSSGSVTPTWKLINVTAPLAPTFLSASRKDTNTLILSMGRPITAPDGSITATQSMDNNILAAQLGQAISTQRIVP